MSNLVRDLNVFFDTYVDYDDSVYERPYSFTFPCKSTTGTGMITNTYEKRIYSTPFSDVNSTPPPGYKYLFSTWDAQEYTSGVDSGRFLNQKRNYFAPIGTEIIGYSDQEPTIYNYPDDYGCTYFNFYSWDSDNKNLVKTKLMFSYTSYWADTGSVIGKSSSFGEIDLIRFNDREISKIPFKVFCGTLYMNRYFNNPNNQFYVHSSPGECITRIGSGFNRNIHETPLSYVSDTFVLPVDNSSATTLYRSLINNKLPSTSIEEYTDALLERTSFSVGYPLSYTVNYKYDGVQIGSKTFTISSHNRLIQKVDLQEKSGYRLSDNPYTPALPATLGPGLDTITVNYESFEYPYSVQYYYDGELGSTKQLTVSSLTNTVSQVPAADKSGYRLADQAYTPALPMVIDDKNNVIRVDYVSWAYPYTVEYYYDGTLGETRKFFARSYANTVTEVPEIGKAGYKLADSPYSPALPAVIDDTNNVIRVDYVSWNYFYTVKYYFGSTLKEKQQFSVPSYNNVISNVPLIESGVFKLAESPYKPALPATINEDNNVIEVHYVSPAALSFSEEMDGTVSNIKRVMVSVIPRAAFFVLLSIFIWFLVKWIRKLLEKG